MFRREKALVGDLFKHTVARWGLKTKVLGFCICKRSIMYILDDGMLDIMDDGYDRPEMNISLIIALIISYSRYPIVPRRFSSFSVRPLNSIISRSLELISYPTHVPLFSSSPLQ